MTIVGTGRHVITHMRIRKLCVRILASNSCVFAFSLREASPQPRDKKIPPWE